MKSRPKLKGILINSVVAGLSVFLTLLLAEALSRIILNPVDYLLPYLLDDDVLGHRIMPGSGGHDAWGYRNNLVPNHADIVAVGDSQTYGVSATARNSWPAILQELTGNDVYNLALGGYGPAEYLYLLKNQALHLKPSLIVVAFYYGNDIMDAYNSVYKNEYWKALRRPDFVANEKVQCPDLDLKTVTGSYKVSRGLKDFRDWLAHHSVVYRVAVYSPIGDLFRSFESKYDYAIEDVTLFEDREHNIQTAFTPLCRFDTLNLDDPRIQEGLHISLDMLRQMSETTKEKGVEFLVVLVPTKERVYARFIENNATLPNSAEIDRLIANERRINEIVKISLEQNSIAYVDVSEALINAAGGNEQIYPTDHDSHPSRSGYQVIARTIQQYLIENSYRD